MMREETNSKILPVFLAGKSLLFLFSLFPIFLFAGNDDPNKLKDTIDNSENKIVIHVSEGATIYNSQLIYSKGDPANISSISKSKQRSKKITAVSRFVKNKIKKPQVLENRTAPIIAERFKKQPVDPVSFFAKNNISGSILLPVNKQVKDLELLKKDYFFIFKIFKNVTSSVVLTDIDNKAHQWQNHVRPPPFFS